jgi:hypothetical protein
MIRRMNALALSTQHGAFIQQLASLCLSIKFSIRHCAYDSPEALMLILRDVNKQRGRILNLSSHTSHSKPTVNIEVAREVSTKALTQSMTAMTLLQGK